jgi:hypothetical protein
MVETPYPGAPLENIRRVGWLLVAIGAAFLILAIAVPAAYQHDLATKTGRARGTIVDYVIYSTGTGPWPLARRPVIDFRTAGGELQRFEPDGNLPGVADHEGQVVSVAYDPENPSQAIIDDIRNVLYPLLLCGAVGLFCLLGGTWVLTRFTSPEQSADAVAA